MQEVDYVAGGFTVQVTGWFVGQDELGMVHQGSGNGHPLPFPTRKLGWEVIHPGPQANYFHTFLCPFYPGGFIHLLTTGEVPHGKFHVIPYTQRRQEVESLEDVSNILRPHPGEFLILHCRDILPSNVKIPLGRGI